jgi:hypothetical protein
VPSVRGRNSASSASGPRMSASGRIDAVVGRDTDGRLAQLGRDHRVTGLRNAGVRAVTPAPGNLRIHRPLPRPQRYCYTRVTDARGALARRIARPRVPRFVGGRRETITASSVPHASRCRPEPGPRTADTPVRCRHLSVKTHERTAPSRTNRSCHTRAYRLQNVRRYNFRQSPSLSIVLP